jgi:hypothetical protein
MNPKKDLKEFFTRLLNTPVEIQGEILTPESQERKHFITFVDSYKKAINRSKEADDKYSLNLWDWDNLFAQSLEGLIFFTFEDYIAELILWYVYEHDLVESEEDWIVTDPEGNPYMIKNAEDLYDLILLLEKL